MARKPSQVSEQSIVTLKTLIREKSGLQCNSFAEAQQLQFYIKTEINEYLSAQTLNRFFGLIRNDFKPASLTLNLLSKYVGYKSFSELELFNTHIPGGKKAVSPSGGVVLSLLAGVQPEKRDEKGLLSVLKNICVLLNREPKLAREIYPFMAATEFGRSYFYGQFVNIDALHGHFGEGLNELLKHSDQHKCEVFALSLLCQRYFLAGARSQFATVYTKLNKVKIYRSELSTGTKARLDAASIYANYLLQEQLPNMERMMEEWKVVGRGEKLESQEIIGAAYVSCGLYAEALQVLTEEVSATEGRNGYRLLQLVARYNCGSVKEKAVVKELGKLQTAKFPFLSETYYEIIMIRLKQMVLPIIFTEELEGAMGMAIQKTGFVHFKRQAAVVESNSVTKNKSIPELNRGK